MQEVFDAALPGGPTGQRSFGRDEGGNQRDRLEAAAGRVKAVTQRALEDLRAIVRALLEREHHEGDPVREAVS